MKKTCLILSSLISFGSYASSDYSIKPNYIACLSANYYKMAEASDRSFKYYQQIGECLDTRALADVDIDLIAMNLFSPSEIIAYAKDGQPVKLYLPADAIKINSDGE